MDEQAPQLAEALKTLRALRAEHPDAPEGLQIAAGIQIGIARSNFGQLQAERREATVPARTARLLPQLGGGGRT